MWLCLELGGLDSLFMQGERRCSSLFLAWGTLGTDVACFHATARERPGGDGGSKGAAAPRAAQPTKGSKWPPPLWGGLWLDLKYCCVVFCLIGVPMFRAFSILCANQRWKAPFYGLFHVFVFVTYKVVYSKYMWNPINSKSICDQSLLIPPFYELIDDQISSLVTVNRYYLIFVYTIAIIKNK
jgi:hypothetical protein